MRRILLIFTALLAAVSTVRADLGGFYFEDVDIRARVRVDNVWEVTETYVVNYTEERHGFYRYIPKKGIDKVEGIWVDGDEFSVSEYENNCMIRIGNDNRYVTGEKTYTITYDYVYFYTKQPDKYELFHTIMGTDFDAPTRHLSFHVDFDKPLSDDIGKTLRVYYGEYGSNKHSLEGITVTPDAISGEYFDVPPLCGVTIFSELPDNYYEGLHTRDHTLLWVLLGGLVLLALVLLVRCLTIKRPLITKVIEFYPPDGLCSAEVGTIIDDSADNVDIASLIPWLASQGYIKVRELGKDDLELTRLKPLPDDAPEYQRLVMELFFDRGDVVQLMDIGEEPEKMQEIKRELENEFKGERKLTRTSRFAFLLLPIAVLGSLLIYYNDPETVDTVWLPAALYGVMFLGNGLLRLMNGAGDIVTDKTLRAFFFAGKLLLVGIVCFFLIFLIPTLVSDAAPIGPVGITAVFVASHLLSELVGRLVVDTEYRAELMGRLLGFKEFLETAEKDRLEELQRDDPQYFFKVLPFAMVFEISNKWTDKFDDIAMEKPDWYEASSGMRSYALASSMNHALNTTANKAFTVINHSTDTSDGSSSSGGGGFSGGGGGGGGGGSW